jgi:hypothetical protein
MDIAKSLSFATEDKKWIEKILIAALLIFSVIGLFAVLGWMVEIIRRIIRQEAEPLPAWGELGRLFVEGLVVAAIGLLWMLPLIVLASCVGVFAGIASALASDGGSDGGLGSIFAICIGFLSLPYSLVVSFLIPPMMGIYALEGKFGEAVNPGKAWRLARANLGGFAVAWILAGVVGFLASTIGTILCLIGAYPLGAYAVAVSGHLYGQASREGLAGLPAT